ncbi:serine/threonine protein kinase [Dictyobacter arantiisoli]|uniref:non-specific serine/threonine protein kinase n=1 Tax=Dictyobacter arantiisoli TaxID=2014874 RepID=A0A5A5TKL1_9CHLR|nr:serine/threonine-protein kinase [Dictyobacter arantiisoli]GCF11805.1 hypothetical protein KDI_53690 [Dictyobacter arantiisoli]
MANTVMHEISFSFDQPDQVLNSLLKLLQQRLRQPLATKTSKEMTVRNALTVLIVDGYQERAQYVGGLLTAVGYRSVIVSNELDAFTSFLQGSFLPLAIILGQEEVSNRLFIQRLVQQLVQRFDWEPLLVRLHSTQQSFFAPQPPQQNPYTPLPQATQPSQQNPYMPLPQATQPSQPLFSLPSQHMTRPLAPTSNQDPASRGASSPNWASSNDIYEAATSSTNSGPLANGPLSRFPPAPVDFSVPYVAPTVEPSTTASTGPSNRIPWDDAARVAPEVKKEPVADKTEPVKKKVYLDGQSLGRYQIRARLGSSSYSEVYRTYDRLREQESALKAIQVDIVPFEMMKESLEEVTVFQQEAELLGPLQHPHILPVSNCGKSYISGNNFIYKNMPFCAEGSLASWLRRNGGNGTFALKDALPIILQLADALQFAHNYQVTYQNFKLTNILVLNQAKRINKLEVALSDFSVVQDGSFFSKLPEGLPYVAPERWEYTVYPASDQYGFAAIVYELLTGRPPFQGASEHIMKILHTTRLAQPPSSLNPKLSKSVDAVLATALAKRPGDRFGSISLFVQTLQRC